MSALVLIDCAIGSSRLYLVEQASASDGSIATREVGEAMPGVREASRSQSEIQPLINAFDANLRKAKLLFEQQFSTETGVSGNVPKLRAVVFGLTSWWLELAFELRIQVFDNVLASLCETAKDITAGAPCCIEPFSRNLEASFEREAVVYAAKHALALDYVDFVISGGLTSVQITPSERYRTAPASVRLRIEDGERVLRDRGHSKWEAECLVQFGPVVGPYHQKLCKVTPGKKKFIVIAIGSFFYGGKLLGLARGCSEHAEEHVIHSEDGSMQRTMHGSMLSDVLRELEDCLNTRSLKSKDASNLIRMRACFSRIFPSDLHNDVRVVFARDWTIKGKSFRTTWTSGYFLKHAEVDDSMNNFEEIDTTLSITKEIDELNPSTISGNDIGRIIRFNDVDDSLIHETTYSERMKLKTAAAIKAHVSSHHFAEKFRWVRLFLCRHEFGPVQDGYLAGVEVTLPPSNASSRFVVIGFVAYCNLRRSNSGSETQCIPCPALGYNDKENDDLPVVDLGILFDARKKYVTLMQGSMGIKGFCIFGSRDSPWNPKAGASYQIWFERREHATSLCIARDKVLTQKYLLSNTHGSFNLQLPAAVQVWIATEMTSTLSTNSKLVINSETTVALSPKIGRQPESTFTKSVSLSSKGGSGWVELTIKPLPSIPSSLQSLAWAKGRLIGSLIRVSEAAGRLPREHLPTWLAESFTPHHDGEEGVRRLSAWPPIHGGRRTDPRLLATAGEHDVWLFRSNTGESLFHWKPLRNAQVALKVWSVAILDVRCVSEPSLQPSETFEVRLLVGCGGDRDDPAQGDNCSVLREHRLTVGVEQLSPSDHVSFWPCVGQKGRGHQERVTGILVDYDPFSGNPKLVYTVSYDRTVIQWSSVGEVLSQARGFHTDKIYNGALSSDGRWLATAAFDHVALFRADEQDGLSCAALISHNFDDLAIQQRWFSVAFVPAAVTDGIIAPTIERKEEVVSSRLSEYATTTQLAPNTDDDVTSGVPGTADVNLPSAIIVGDQNGQIWLVALCESRGTLLRLSQEVHFVNICSKGVEIAKHQDCVRQLCWLEGTLGSSSTGFSSSEKAWSSNYRFACCKLRMRGGDKSPGTDTVSNRGGLRNSDIVSRALCSSSTDRTVRLYDASDIRSQLENLFDSLRNASGGDLSVSQLLSARFSKLTSASLDSHESSGLVGEASLAEEFIGAAVEICFHQGPVRAAGPDGCGNLYTGSLVIAKWDDLLRRNKGDQLYVPCVSMHEADIWNVTTFWSTIAVVALQMLYFTANRGVFATGKSQDIIRPIALLTKLVSVDDDMLGFLWETMLDWALLKHMLFFGLSLFVFLCPWLLRIFYFAYKHLQVDVDLIDEDQRKSYWRKKLVVFIMIYLVFGLSAVPTFRVFTELIVCPKGDDGEYRMHTHNEVICFEMFHVALSICCWAVGSIYLACGLLLESYYFAPENLLEVSINGEECFPVSATSAEMSMCQREISLRHLFHVALMQFLPGVTLESPMENVGVFTETPSKGKVTVRLRFVMKVLFVLVDKISGFGETADRMQMQLFTVLAFVNLILHCWFPPMLDKRIGNLVLAIQSAIFLGSAVALLAVIDTHVSSHTAYAIAYLCAVIVPICLYVCGGCCCACCSRRRSQEMQEPSQEVHPNTEDAEENTFAHTTQSGTSMFEDSLRLAACCSEETPHATQSVLDNSLRTLALGTEESSPSCVPGVTEDFVT